MQYFVCCASPYLAVSFRVYFLVDSLFTNQMEKFTGADLTEICQRAAKIAIRENIMKVGAAPCPTVPWLL